MYILSKSDIIKFIVPPVLACILFVVTLFGLVLPVSKNNMMEQKKDAIAILTQTAINTLGHYYKLAQSGELTEDNAQALAVQQIRDLRYGAENKDYFWINDLQPRMIMHPYRPDLEGQDLGNYRDIKQKHLFVEFVETVKLNGSGYVPYHWQWKDLPEQVVPKLSYVTLFEPWGWIIGTGVYLDDVQQEFARTSQKLVYISVLILILIILLSVLIIHQGIRETRKRRLAEQELEKYNENLEKLIKQRTADLEDALSQVKLLSGFLPICASCKKIRDDKGYWNQLEDFIQKHSEAEFSHGVCPDCAKKLYPDLEIYG